MAITKTTAKKKSAPPPPPVDPPRQPTENASDDDDEDLLNLVMREEEEEEDDDDEEEEEEEAEEEGEDEPEEEERGKKRKHKGKGPMAKKKSKVSKSATLTNDQELEMSEWISQHPLLYDRSMVEYYKSTALRDRLWFKKAVELGILDEDAPFISSKINPLYKWFLNVRTRLKRTKPSGSSGRSRLRERFLQSKFGFILAADAAAVGGHQERQERQQLSYKKKLATPSTSQQQTTDGDLDDTAATGETALDDLPLGDDIIESLRMESTVPAASTTVPTSSNTALSQMIHQNRQLSSQISNLLDQHTQSQSGSGVRAAAGASFAASLMTEVHPSLQMAMQQHVLHTVFQYIRRTDEILGRPQEQPPYQYLQQSSGFFPPPPFLHHHIDNPYQMQQHFSMGAPQIPPQIRPQMSSQQMTAPPQMSSQQMTAPPQMSSQQMTAPPQMSSQQMTAPPQMSSQQMTAPPQMSSQQMTAPPQMSSQQMTATTTPTYTTLQNAPSSTSRSSSGAATSSVFWSQALGPPTPTTAVRATTETSPGSNMSTPQNVSTPEPPPLCSPATIDALEGMLQ